MSSFIFLHKYFHYFIITPYDVQVAVHCTCDNIGDTRDMKNKMKQGTYLILGQMVTCSLSLRIFGKKWKKKRQLVIVADTTSATGSEKNAASAVKSAGRKISPARKINFRKAEQKSASFTLPRAVVSSTSGYCMASGMIIKVNRLI